MRRLARLRALPSAERRLLFRAWALLLVTPLLLRVLPLRRLLAPGRVVAPVAAIAVERVAWLVEVAARHAPGARCLPVAIVTARLLARQGTPARLCIGVARHASGLSAHAWLERDGRPLGAAGEGYAPILGAVVSAS